jgi:hypothetical protein
MGRVWLRIGAVAWALVLIASAIYATSHGEPTAREQTTIVEALPTVDGAVAAVAQTAAGTGTGAGGPAPAVVAIGGYERTESRCRAGNRSGERYQRAVQVYTLPGQESALVDRVAAALPRSYRPSVRHAGTIHALRADAGFYVRLTGGTSGPPGELRFIADTGCRLRGGTVPAPGAAPTVPPVAAAALGRLGGTPAGARTDDVGCAGRLQTVSVTMARPATPLSAAVPPGVAPLIAREDLVAYYDAAAGVAVRLRADDVIVTVTSACQ